MATLWLNIVGLNFALKLSLAIFSDSPVLLLDEPCTNFDHENIKWYANMIKEYCDNQLIIVASNNANEYNFCNEHINIQNFKYGLQDWFCNQKF